MAQIKRAQSFLGSLIALLFSMVFSWWGRPAQAVPQARTLEAAPLESVHAIDFEAPISLITYKSMPLPQAIAQVAQEGDDPYHEPPSSGTSTPREDENSDENGRYINNNWIQFLPNENTVNNVAEFNQPFLPVSCQYNHGLLFESLQKKAESGLTLTEMERAYVELHQRQDSCP